MSLMKKHPNIYEINTRVWLKKLQSHNTNISLSQIPDDYWLKLKKLGMDYVWLMGVWETVPASVDKYCFTPGLMEEYKNALPDWKKEDVIGSPYAINNYKLNPILGVHEELYSLKKQLNYLELKLILDFIPNHFHADTELLKSNPEVFLKANNELQSNDALTYYKAEVVNEYFAHGKDPNFAAWQDTVQVNYFSSEARNHMIEQLISLTEICDGVRCDVAMLVSNDVFKRTWHKVIKSTGLQEPESEFWIDAIKRVKSKNKRFIFLAEVYWNMEWILQQQGFDYTYDKSLYDRLKKHNASSIIEHLKADINYQSKSVRFIENHDEQRALPVFGEAKSKAAAIVLSTIPGMHFFNDGQFEGKTIKLPVQLEREPAELINTGIENFYTKLLETVKTIDTVRFNWELMECSPSGEDDSTYKNFIAFKWYDKQIIYVIITNYSKEKSYCRLKLDTNHNSGKVSISDKLNNYVYERKAEELSTLGIFIALSQFESHFFEIKL